MFPRVNKNYILLMDFIFIVVSLLVYHAFFWNKYIGLQDGWGNVYASYLEHGKVPYRDFYLFSQPLSIFLSYLLTHVFGNTIIVLRAFGILERVIMTLLLYLLYKRITPRPIALLASIVSLILFSGTNMNSIYTYYQTCLTLLLLSCYVVILYIVRDKDNTSSYYILIAGLLGGLAFLTKQTTGLVIPCATLFFLMFFDYKQQNKWIKNAFYYLVAFLIPSLVMIAVFIYLNAGYDYLQQIFVSASSAKGGLFVILIGAVFRHRLDFVFFFPLSFILALLFIFQRHVFISPPNKKMLLPFFIIAVGIVIGYIGQIVGTVDFVVKWFVYKNLIVYIIFDTYMVLFLYWMNVAIKKSIHVEGWQWLYLIVVSLSLIYAYGLSYTYDVYALLLGGGLFIILLYSIHTNWNAFKNVLLYLCCIITVSSTLMQHCLWPYDWWGWGCSPVKMSTTELDLKPLKGLKMDHYQNRVISHITQIIRQQTTPHETIYVFPLMPIFYLLADRYPITRTITDYFDVSADDWARENAALLNKTPPKVIVMEEFSHWFWIFHEYVFRNGQGHHSGQRKIFDTLNALIVKYHYVKEATYLSTDSFLGSHLPISVWVRHES